MITDDTIDQTEALNQLKEEADLLGISYSPNIGLETLRQRVNDKKQSESPELSKEEKLRKAAYDEAHRLVRCVITCHNPNKLHMREELFIVSGEYFGTIKRIVPLGSRTQNGWHIENAIYKHIKDKQFPMIETGRDPNTGRQYQKAYMTNEYSIFVKEELTQKELDDIKARQIATGYSEQKD